ncbi:MAG: DUF2851 family protein [Verrucomicrobiales bacterium]
MQSAPQLELAARYERFRDDVSASISERPLFPMPGAIPPEMELQSRWFAGEFGRRFTSTCGRPVEIVQFGHWNHAAGPDFSEVAVRIGDEIRSGTLELDTHPRDWEAHGHAENPNYDDVCLHLYVVAPPGDRYFTRTSSHREVIQVQLDLAAIDQDAPVYFQAEAKLGRCSQPLAGMGATELAGLLEAAAQFRLQRKSRRFHRVAEIHGRQQAFFQGIAEALGYRNNKLAMTVLAQRLPICSLLRDKADAEAKLFGLAGFLAAPSYEGANDEARPYLRELWETWWKVRDRFANAGGVDWNLAGVRPANHPQRRVGALAAIVGEWRKVIAMLDVQGYDERSFKRLLSGLEHPYWSHHFTLSSKPSMSPMALVGKARIAELLANQIYPALVPERPSLWAHYLGIAAQLDNQKVRRAALRLFGEERGAKAQTKYLFQQQALLQIYDDFCLADTSGCEECPFPEQLKQWS